jgi:hypothetical protein
MARQNKHMPIKAMGTSVSHRDFSGTGILWCHQCDAKTSKEPMTIMAGLVGKDSTRSSDVFGSWKIKMLHFLTLRANAHIITQPEGELKYHEQDCRSFRIRFESQTTHHRFMSWYRWKG